jgi:hypothetical protein
MKPLMDLSLAHIESGQDQNTKRIIWTVLRTLLASINGVNLVQFKLSGMKLSAGSPLLGTDCAL